MKDTTTQECRAALAQNTDLELEWAAIKKAAAGSVRVQQMIEDAIGRGRHTSEYTRADQDLWATRKLKEGRKGSYIRGACQDFRCIARQAGLENLFPLLPGKAKANPAKSLAREEMSLSLQRDLRMFFAKRRLSAHRSQTELNPLTEFGREAILQELCWYAAKELHIDPLTRLNQVLQEPVVHSWALWLHEDEKCSRDSVKNRLYSIHSTLRKHPDYWNRDLAWVTKPLRQIPPEPEGAKCATQTACSIDFKELVVAVRRIREDRLAAPACRSAKAVGWLVHDQLLFMFLAFAQWSSQSVIRCRVGKVNPNLFKGPLRSEDMPLDIQGWAKELCKKERGARLWQYCFSPRETRAHTTVHGVLHNFLIPLLEVYLKRYRGKLLGGKPDPGTLFFSRKGRPMAPSAFIFLIGDLTSKYCPSEKRIIPSGISRSFANYWERQHQGKHEQLALIQGRRIPTIRAKFPKQ
jgi:hypothetical protein